MEGLGKSSPGGMGEAETSLVLEALPRRGLLTPMSREESFAALRSSVGGPVGSMGGLGQRSASAAGYTQPGRHGLGVP